MATTATATQVRNTKNETIVVNGDVIRKAVLIGKYNYACEFWVGTEGPWVGVSGTRANAEKWAPFQASMDIYPTKKSDDDHTRALFSNRMFDAKKKYGAPKTIRRNGYTYYRFTRPVRRVVTKIERS